MLITIGIAWPAAGAEASFGALAAGLHQQLVPVGNDMKNKIIRSSAFAAFAVAASIVTAPAASAEELPNCFIAAEPPRRETSGDNVVVVGTAYRRNCEQHRNITVRIRQDLPILPDRTIVSKSLFDVVNVTINVVWDCRPGDGGTFFTEILTSAGGKRQSPHVSISCVG